MNTLAGRFTAARPRYAYLSSNGMLDVRDDERRRRHKFDLSDYLLLTGVALVPFVAPMPGPTSATPSSVAERVTLCDGFFVLAMLIAAWQRAKQELSGWLNRRPRGFSVVPALPAPTWRLPPVSPIWFCSALVLAVMVLSWFANPLMPINPHMLVAIAVQVYLAIVAVMCASAVCRYGTPQPILVAWVVGFLILAIICTYDSGALITNRRMIYPGVEGRLRGPFRTTGQLAAYSLSSFFVLLAAAKFVSPSRWVSKAGVLACMAPLFIVLASRRSAVASLVVGYVALLAVSKHRLRIFLGTAVPPVTIVLSLFLFGPPELQAYLINRARPLIGQDKERVDIAEDHFSRGLAAFQEHPVLGIGFGAFSDTRFGELTESITHEQHSGYIAILAETGAVGFSIMMLLHVAVFYVLVQTWRNSTGRYRELVMYMMVVLVALGVSEVYNRIWRERGMWIIAGMIAALPLIVQQDRLAKFSKTFRLNGSLRSRIT
ncbi:MAG: O-antigen ligase family protein [Planctomycetia bacterium]|nr:O-antigen ligase family protein [Planctomycetia bacterium]